MGQQLDLDTIVILANKKLREGSKVYNPSEDNMPAGIAAYLFEEAILLNPNIAGLHNQHGFALTYLGNYEKAHNSFSKAIDLEPDNPIFYQNRIFVLKELGKSDLSVFDYEKIQMLEPFNPVVFVERANMLVQLARFGEALNDFSRAIELEPHNPSHYIERAGVHRAMRNYGKGLSDCETAIGLAADNPTVKVNALIRRSSIYGELGRDDEALEVLKQAISIDPNNSFIYFSRADLFRKMGDQGRYNDDLVKALSLLKNTQ
jgi:tetratricopeptide (TPR) repeat protein